MIWKKLLMFDLGRLFGRNTAPLPERTLADTWFVRLFRRVRRHVAHDRVTPMPTNHEPCFMYRRSLKRLGKRAWPGPFYWRMRRWQQDLLHVTAEITAIVRLNASLTKGLEVAASEEHRLNRVWSRKWFARLTWSFFWTGVAVIVLTILLGRLFLDPLQEIFTIPGNRYYGDLVLISLLGSLALLLASIVFFKMVTGSGASEAVMLTLRDRLNAGRSLSEAMAAMPRFFPPLHADLVRAGEESGKLVDCLEQLGEETLNMISTRTLVRRQLAYLGLVALIQAGLFAFIATKVMPVFFDIFHEFGVAPSPQMRATEAIADFVYYRGWWLLGCAVIAALFVVFRRLSRVRTFGTGRLSGLFGVIPGVRTLIVRQNTGVIALMLEKLLRAGAPLPRALASAANADLNKGYVFMLERLTRRVENGDSFADACAAESYLLPVSFRSMVAIGEHSGMLPDALAGLAEHYRRSIERFTRVLVDMVTPIGVVAIGMFTLLIEASLFTMMTGIVDGLIGAI